MKRPRTGIRYQPPAKDKPRRGKTGARPEEADGDGFVDELRVLVFYEGYKEPNVISWTRGSLRFRSTREAAVEFLRGLADELEGSYQVCPTCKGRRRVRVDGKEEK